MAFTSTFWTDYTLFLPYVHEFRPAAFLIGKIFFKFKQFHIFRLILFTCERYKENFICYRIWMLKFELICISKNCGFRVNGRGIIADNHIQLLIFLLLSVRTTHKPTRQFAAPILKYPLQSFLFWR